MGRIRRIQRRRPPDQVRPMKRAGTIKVEARGPDGPIEAFLLPPGAHGVRVEIKGADALRDALAAAQAQIQIELEKAMRDVARRSAREARRQ